MTPALTTSRLLLRPYYAGMVTDAHVGWLNDPEVVRYSEQRHKKHTIESVHAYVNGVNTGGSSHIWAIDALVPHDYTEEARIGTITAHIDRPNGVANIGIMIGNRAYWGRGYGQEAWLTVCNWLFETGIRKIEAGCHYENRGMRALAETSGMHLEGVRHDHFVVDGKPQHLLLYAKMRPVSVKVQVDESAPAKPIRKRDIKIAASD